MKTLIAPSTNSQGYVKGTVPSLTQQRYEDTWVKLLETPTPVCSDEAWLMCEYPDGSWAAWIPDYGQVILRAGQFYR